MTIWKKQSIAIAIALAAVIGVSVASFYPQAQRAFALIKEMDDTEQALEKQYALRTHMRKAIAGYTDAQRNIKRISNLVAVKKDNELAFITAIEKAADTAGVTHDLTVLTVNAVTISPWQNTVPFTINVRGTYRGISTFMAAIETLPYATNFSAFSIRIDGDATASGNPALIGTIKGTFYRETTPPPFLQHDL